jgi:hypothetical protein
MAKEASMTDERIAFQSAGLKINGALHRPLGMKPGERRPAFMVLHGFGSNGSSSNCVLPAQMLAEWGYVALRFDFRGCGDSEGKRANTICLEQVEDTSAALSFLQTRPEVDPARIAAVGSSFGAAVAVYTGGVDKRVGAVISSGGWGDGESKFRKQHAAPEAWQKFTDMMARGKAERARHRANPGAFAHQSRQELDHGVHLRDGREHVRFPRQRGRRQDRAAAFAAAARG